MVNRILGLSMLFLSILYFLLAPLEISDKGVPPNSPPPIYPQFFPKILAIFGCLLSLSLFLMSISRTKLSSDEDIDIPTKSNMFRVLLAVVVISIYIFTFDLLGYLISTAVSLILFMVFFGLRDIKYIFLTIVTVPPIIYYVFKKMLYVPFPPGLFGFQ